MPRGEPGPYLVNNQDRLVPWDSGVGFMLGDNPLTYVATVMFRAFRVCCEIRSFVPL